MKKILVTIFIFIFFSMNLYAQGFVFTGDISSGLWSHWNDKKDGDSFLQIAANDAVPARINFRGAYDNMDNTLGFAFNLRGQARNVPGAAEKPRMDPNRNNDLNDIIYFEKAVAYINAFNGLVTLKSGYWEATEYETPGGLSTTLGMDGAGLTVDIKPLPGLNIMAGGWATEGDTTLLKEAKYIISVFYTLPDIFRTTTHFAFRPLGPIGFSKDDDINNRYGPDGYSSYDEKLDKDQRFVIGVGYLGLQDFGFTRLMADARIHNLGGAKSPNWNGTKMIRLTPFMTGQRITWTTGNLTLDGRFKQRFNLLDDRWNYGPSTHSRITARYDFRDTPLNCDISPKLGFDLFTNTNAWGDNPVDMRFDEGITDWEECTRERGGWGINPAVELRFGDIRNAAVEMGYSLKVNTSKPDDTISIRDKSTINHAAYIFIRVSVGRIVEEENNQQ